MGSGWYIARQHGGPAELPHKGRALLFAQYQLEEIAKQAGLPALKSFFSSNPQALTAYFHAAGIERSPDEFPDEAWFEAGELLPTVRLLTHGLKDSTVYVPQVERVQEELSAMLSILESAESENDPVHVATGLPHRDAPPESEAE